MKRIAIIPARMGSSRFPGKPLAPILGKPMIQWVYEGTRLCRDLDAVCIATCDEEIRQAAETFGAPVMMTSATHQRASDRVAEAAEHFGAGLVVMVQGDEPLVEPDMIARAIEPFRDPAVVCTNLAAPITEEDEFRDVNTVKVVVDEVGNALYFSRQAVPTCTPSRPAFGLRQVCIIGFRAGFLRTYTQLPQTPAEVAESIDMLRVLEHGFRIRIVMTAKVTHPVDTVADIAKVERLLEGAPVR